MRGVYTNFNPLKLSPDITIKTSSILKPKFQYMVLTDYGERQAGVIRDILQCKIAIVAEPIHFVGVIELINKKDSDINFLIISSVSMDKIEEEVIENIQSSIFNIGLENILSNVSGCFFHIEEENLSRISGNAFEFKKYINDLLKEYFIQKNRTFKEKYRITDEQAKEYDSSLQLYPNLILEKTLTIISSPPGMAKTEFIYSEAAPCIIKNFPEKTIHYIDMDSRNSVRMKKLENEYQDNLIWHPLHIKGGITAKSYLNELIQIIKSDIVSQKDEIYVFDCLKNFATVGNKVVSAEQIQEVFRQITLRQGTVVLLNHCTKMKDKDGFSVPEGGNEWTGLVDVHIIFIPVGEPNREERYRIISTLTDFESDYAKARGDMKPFSFRAYKGMRIELLHSWLDPREEAPKLKKGSKQDIKLQILKAANQVGEANPKKWEEDEFVYTVFKKSGQLSDLKEITKILRDNIPEYDKVNDVGIKKIVEKGTSSGHFFETIFYRYKKDHQETALEAEAKSNRVYPVKSQLKRRK